MNGFCVGLLVVMFCQTEAPEPATIDTYCLKYRPVRISHRDTRGSKEQNDVNNKIYKSDCMKGGR